MPNSSSVSDWKNKTISMILNNDEIIDCLDLSESEFEEPVYTRIFPYNHIPQTIEETKVFITVSVSIPKITFNKIWAYPRLTIRIISHQEKMKLNKAGVSATRIDYISQLVDKMLAGRTEFGYGRLSLVTNDEYLLNITHHCREMVFIGEDLVESQCSDM